MSKKLILMTAILALCASVLAGCGPAEVVGITPTLQQPPANTQLLTDVPAQPAQTRAPTDAPAQPAQTPARTATDPPLPTAKATTEPEWALGTASELHLTIVYDNTNLDPRLTGDWGFAAWIEYGGHTLLFDTGGMGHILLNNLGVLGLDPQLIEIVVLSHSHGDHTGGLQGLLDTGIRPVVYVPAAFPRSFKDMVRAQTELVEVTDPVEIVPGLRSTGQLLRNVVEQGLVVETGEGMVVITGCAHPGILRMVERAHEVVEGEIALVVGGFHMGEYSQREIEDTIAGFRENGVRQVTATHCTGESAQAMFREAYGKDCIDGGVGKAFVIGAAEGPGTASEAPSADRGFLLAGVGFATPESVLYDPESDLYLVSNINGSPGARDGNGFISRISPQGELMDLKWVDGRAEGVTLNEPTGMALSGTALIVADGGAVRFFDRDTGAPLREVVIAGAVFLNDLAAAGDGTVYVTDSGADAVYRIAADGTVAALDVEPPIAGPNGIQVQGDSLLIASYDDRWVHELDSNGQMITKWELPNGGLDGLIWLADLGFDPVRQRVLIPHFQHNRVEAKPLP